MNKLLLFALVVLVISCRDTYDSPAPEVVTGFLVVDGVVNDGGGVTNIRLSRTTSLRTNKNLPENGAIVRLEYSNNSSMLLLQSGPGNYTINNLHLDTTLRYRLSIKTNNNEEYLSDFVTVKNNPAIDSVSWVRENDGVEIFINTHDPQNNTRYYQWEYDETWEFHSYYTASLKYIIGPPPGNAILAATYRDTSDPNISTCWQFNSSSALLLGSSAKLSQDKIHLPLIHIPNASWKLSVLYSIYVKQYTWSREGYEFLERMKKNTESLGSVFDAQPSELNGNIHCTTNPAQPAIGFFNICTVREKRIFINNRDLPRWGYNEGCSAEEIENNKDSIMRKATSKLPTYPAIIGPFGSIITFYASEQICVDCTLRGTNVKPVYWP